MLGALEFGGGRTYGLEYVGVEGKGLIAWKEFGELVVPFVGCEGRYGDVYAFHSTAGCDSPLGAPGFWTALLRLRFLRPEVSTCNSRFKGSCRAGSWEGSGCGSFPSLSFVVVVSILGVEFKASLESCFIDCPSGFTPTSQVSHVEQKPRAHKKHT